jgi:hypothetical protein
MKNPAVMFRPDVPPEIQHDSIEFRFLFLSKARRIRLHQIPMLCEVGGIEWTCLPSCDVKCVHTF